MRVIYQTAVANINVAIGSTKELASSQIHSTETVDYLLGGALTLRNGRIDKYQFDEGYCQASAAGSVDYFDFYYYDRDHLGNIRRVIIPDDNPYKSFVIQTMDYYPFGAPYADATAIKGAAVQPYKYNGKELDLMHGLNTYDYGARQHAPVLARWDRIDPLCEKYYSTSPYAYCMNNPVRFIDPDGKKVYVFAMKLPSPYSAVRNSGATHTFTVVKTSDGKIYRYAYGPTDDKVIHSVSGTTNIVERNYSQDGKAVKNYFNTGKEDNNTKNVTKKNDTNSQILLEISMLPLRQNETGNTLETRGLTYSYTFYTNPKNALTGCKGTKESANAQTFFGLFASLYVYCSLSHQNIVP